jgi:hypothetical protein
MAGGAMDENCPGALTAAAIGWRAVLMAFPVPRDEDGAG